MSWTDLLLTSLGNLWRRKVRSVLTLLGVVIGITSIVVLVSLGIAAEEATIAQAAQYDDITMVDVYSNYGGMYYGSDDGSDAGALIDKITDEVIEQVAALEHVVVASPYYDFYPPDGFLKLKLNRYVADIGSLTAVKPGLLEALGYTPEYGEFFGEGRSRNMQLVLSPYAMLAMRDPRKNSDSWVDYTEYLANDEPLPYPDLDWENGRFQLILESYTYDENTGATSTKETRIKRAEVVGTILATKDMGYNLPWGVYVNIDVLLEYMRSEKKTYESLLKDLEENGYGSIKLKVDSIDNVELVLEALKDMGLPSTNSPMQWIESMRASIQNIQVLLGGISAISLLVAALSIANTMMMSIYERTREIGVMKVLGCSLGNIRSMFLLEAGFIGLFGGGLGVGLSYALSYAMNEVPWISARIMEFTGMLDSGLDVPASVIPIWLSMGAWGFGVVVALLSGIYPAQRAMWLSPLAAIRNE